MDEISAARQMLYHTLLVYLARRAAIALARWAEARSKPEE